MPQPCNFLEHLWTISVQPYNRAGVFMYFYCQHQSIVSLWLFAADVSGNATILIIKSQFCMTNSIHIKVVQS